MSKNPLKHELVSFSYYFLFLTFQYKKQPQAEKHIYERVNIDTSTVQPSGTPHKLASTTDGEDKPNDLIQYYNSVFVKEMMSYMKENSEVNNAPPLSPLPKVKN